MLSRIKFDIEELFTEMLDQLPSEVFESSETTFVDVEAAGGQSYAAIKKRLLKAGHTEENIKKRVTMFFNNSFEQNFAINKNSVNCNTEARDILKNLGAKKFDVVIGNPPYQSGNGESGGRHSLWRKIISKSFELLNNQGYIAMVCPGFPLESNDIGSHLKNNTPIILKNDVTEHFPGIGSDIKYWVVKHGKHNLPFVVDGKKWKDLSKDPTVNETYHSICTKTQSYNKFECKYDGGYNSTQLKNDPNDYFELPKGKSIYPIRHGSNTKVCYVSKPTESHNLSKVTMTFSGYPGFAYSDTSNPMSSCLQMSGYILVENKKEADNLINLYNTKFYKFLSAFNNKGMRGRESYCLPKLDLNKTYSDNEIYNIFNLSTTEINFVENYVK
jgi:hypothetical protein